MRRLLLLAALAPLLLLEGGCSNTCSTLTVAWPSFLLADGSLTPSCGLAGISAIEVFGDGQLLGSFPCTTGGVALYDTPDGAHTITVEGLDLQGHIILRDQLALSIGGCSSLDLVAQPAEGYAELEYDFYRAGQPLSASADVCGAPASTLWLSLTDTLAGATAYSFDAGNAAQAPLCESTQRRLHLPLAIGSYTLDWVEERDPSRGQALLAAACTPLSFNISAATGTTVAVPLDVGAARACR
jgi:hypothetical protein